MFSIIYLYNIVLITICLTPIVFNPRLSSSILTERLWATATRRQRPRRIPLIGAPIPGRRFQRVADVLVDGCVIVRQRSAWVICDDCSLLVRFTRRGQWCRYVHACPKLTCPKLTDFGIVVSSSRRLRWVHDERKVGVGGDDGGLQAGVSQHGDDERQLHEEDGQQQSTLTSAKEADGTAHVRCTIIGGINDIAPSE